MKYPGPPYGLYTSLVDVDCLMTTGLDVFVA